MGSYKSVSNSILGGPFRYPDKNRRYACQIGLRAMRLAGYLITAAAMLCFGCTSEAPVTSRNINGITARFKITTPEVRVGGRLKVRAVFRNETDHTVKAWLLPAAYDSKVWREGVEEFPCLTPEVPAVEVVFRPRQEISVEDEITIDRCYKPGLHEIRFYNSTTVFDVRKHRFPADNAIPWEDRGHRFMVEQ
jgi:hypothetical protein